MNREFIVTTYTDQNQINRSTVWDSSEPFAIGYPFRWVLEKTPKGFRLRDLKEHSIKEFSENSIESVLSEGSLRFRIHPARSLNSKATFTPTQVGIQKISSIEDIELFKKSTYGAIAGLFLLISIAFLMPKHETSKEEIIPAQFAKIIMTPRPKTSQSSTKGGANDTAGGEKAGNVVQAFKSTQVQHSTQKLLKGGVLALLAKSNILSSHSSKAALSAIFDHGQKSRTLSSIAGLDNIKTVAVNTLGGQGGSQGGVGYGKGEKAGVQGQGNSFVALETADSQVEEGLSKDEVGRVIHSHIAEVRYCYESAMIRNAAVQGKLIIDFVIQGSGRVKTAKVNSSTLNDSPLDQCILSRLMKWEFPKPKGGVDVAVTYPFILKSLGK